LSAPSPWDEPIFTIGHGGHGTALEVETLRLRRYTLTPGVHEVVCLAGAADGFADGSAKLLQMLA
jgi:hypothetical protein